MESQNPNIASIVSQNTMIQDIYPRVEEQVNSQEQEQQGNRGREEDVGVD